MTRRCGSRVVGGIYLDLPLSKYGEPIESFICDPARIVPAELEIPDRGMVLRTGPDGSLMLLDHIGDQYPNVLDFIEEVRAQGLSRRIQENFDFSQLNGRVKYCATHKRGYVHNEPWYRQYAQNHPITSVDGIPRETPWPCPKGIHPVTHTMEDPCSAVWWHDLIHGHGEPTDKSRIVRVDQPAGGPYFAMERPEEIVPIYSEAIIVVFPVVKLAVIRGKEGEHEKPIERARTVGQGVTVTLEDE
jgi:hypothetical protein